MIQFFRKLRFSSLSRKRFPKYLLYATGEIVLVVIGILIALQINNCNENRQERQQEQVLLKQL
jgi:sensor domain CHASE-containing protein